MTGCTVRLERTIGDTTRRSEPPSNLLQTTRGARCREAVRAEACLVDLKDRHQSLQLPAKSQQSRRELIFALQQNRFEDRIVPLLYQPCDLDRLSWMLSSFQPINFQRPFEDGCRDLLRLWGLGYQPSP